MDQAVTVLKRLDRRGLLGANVPDSDLGHIEVLAPRSRSSQTAQHGQLAYMSQGIRDGACQRL